MVLMDDGAPPAADAAAAAPQPTTSGSSSSMEGAGGIEPQEPPQQEEPEPKQLLSREVEAALLLMEGNEADEAKFAGLLLLVKHLQQQQQQKGEGGEEDQLAAGDARARLLDAVGARFLARLLATPSYAPLALAVLRTLAQDPTLLPRLRTTAILGPLVALLESAETEAGVQEDCLSLLHAFATHDAGATALLARAGAGPAVVQCLVASASAVAGAASAGAAATEEKDKEGGKEEEVPPLATQACAVLEALVAAEGRALLLPGKRKGAQAAPPLLLDGLSLGMLTGLLARERRASLRFALLPLLATVFAQRRGGTGGGVAEAMQAGAKEEGKGLPASFPASLRATLLPWLHGSVREAQRDGALALLVHALGLLGQTWAVEDKEEGEEEGDGKKATTRMGHGAAAGVLVSALAAEVRMLADEVEGLVAAAQDAELRGDANLKARLERARRLLPLCLDGLDSVLRFLCGAGDGECPLPTVLEGADAAAMHEKEWATLPSPVILGMRSAIHGAVAGVLKMLQDAAADLQSPSNPLPHGLPLVYHASARFLSAVLSEDPHCLTPTEALAGLPVIRALTNTAAETMDEAEASPTLPPHLPLPWVARALDADAGSVDALVDQGAHLWLIDQLALPSSDPGAWPLHPRCNALGLLHSMLSVGGRVVPCVDHDCPLGRHPKLQALLPHMAATVGDPQAAPRWRLHAAWFILSLVVGEGNEEGEEGGALFGDDDAAVALLTRPAVVDGLADVLAAGRRVGWGLEEDEEGEEGQEEDRALWARVVGMVASASAGSAGLELETRVPAAVAARYGRREGEAVGELLLEAMAGREAEAAVLRGRLGR